MVMKQSMLEGRILWMMQRGKIFWGIKLAEMPKVQRQEKNNYKNKQKINNYEELLKNLKAKDSLSTAQYLGVN